MKAPLIPPEFSRSFGVDRLGITPVTHGITASEQECALLAQRLGLVALGQLSASVQLQRLPGGDLVRVAGRLEADVMQTCVVTLEVFPSHVEDSFTVDFSSDPDGDSAGVDEDINLDMEYEPPEPIVGGVIDIGELTAQYLSLALDPHPRAPGVALNAIWEGEDSSALSPFAVLKNLKQNS